MAFETWQGIEEFDNWIFALHRESFEWCVIDKLSPMSKYMAMERLRVLKLS